MSYQKSYLDRRWTNSWSGRGTALLDKVEGSCAAPVILQPNYTTPLSKLKRLVAEFPFNRFYRSLINREKPWRFTPKQLQCIEADFLKQFGQNA